MVEVDQSGRTRARSRQGVDLGDREPPRDQLTISEGMQPLAGGLLAVLRRGFSVLRGQRPLLGVAGAELCGCGALALHRCAREEVGPGTPERAGVVVVGDVAGELQVARIGGPVARRCREVTALGDRIALGRGSQAGLGSRLAPAGSVVANVTAELVRARSRPVAEVAIAGGLVAVGRPPIPICTRLVAVGARLVGVRQGLVGIGERLLAVCERALLVEVDRQPVLRPRAAGLIRCRPAGPAVAEATIDTPIAGDVVGQITAHAAA